MSSWKIDYEHDSDATVALKKQIANQDNRCATLENQLLKLRETLEETKGAHNESVYKLRQEADRTVRLDQELTERKESLDNERLTRQNAENALQNALAKLKEEEAAKKDLQQIMEKMSSQNSGSTTALTNIQREKAALERRVRELEVNLQHVVSSTTPSRPRASSHDGKVLALQRELADTRDASSKYQVDLTMANDRLARLEADLCRVENERTTLERKLGARVQQLEEELLEKDDDLQRLKGQHGDISYAREREEELMRRVEEEEAKVAAMERLLAGSRDMKTMEDALQKAEKKLAMEIKKARGLEEKNVVLSRGKVEALASLDESQQQVQALSVAVQDRDARIAALDAQESDLRVQLERAQHNLDQALSNDRPSNTTFDAGLKSFNSFTHHSTPTIRFTESLAPPHIAPPEDAVTEASLEKLLAAIERLRAERNGLRRDLEFLQLESKFTVESLEHKLAEATASSITPIEPALVRSLRQEAAELREQLSRSAGGSHLGLTATAALVSIGHLQSRIDEDSQELQRSRAELSLLRTDGEAQARDTFEKLEVIQRELHEATDNLLEADHLRNNLLDQVSHLHAEADDLREAAYQANEERADLRGALREREEELDELSHHFANVESSRDSLSVQVVNLENEVAFAQSELAIAEERYRSLQTEQLSSMSSTQVTRALREQINELEGRVMRRTEQIGIHQHDIKRLETNLRLQEERIDEMTGELEMAITDKASMVEDCAEAREARDRALRRVEELEIDVETLEEQVKTAGAHHAQEVVALVSAWSDAATNAKAARQAHRTVLLKAESAISALEQQLREASSQYLDAMELLQERSTALEGSRQDIASACDDALQTILALSVSQSALNHTRRTLQSEQGHKAHLAAQLEALRQELDLRLEDISKLQESLQATREQQSHDSANMKALHDAKHAELESEMARMRDANAEWTALQVELESKLAHSAEELQLYREQHEQLAGMSGDAENQLTLMRNAHALEVSGLQQQLNAQEVLLQKAKIARVELEATHLAAQAAIAAEKVDLEERLRDVQAQLTAAKERLEELAGKETERKEQRLALEERLAHAEEELRAALQTKDKLEATHQQTADEIALAKADFVKQLADSTAALDALQRKFDSTTERHAQEVGSLQEELQRREEESQQLRGQWEAESVERAQEQTTYIVERKAAVERVESAEAARAELRRELSSVEAQLQEVNALYEELQTENAHIEGSNTELTAELQRQLSMQRFLESQIKQGEREMAALKAELERVRDKNGRAEAEGKKAEMELALQSARYEHTVSSLQNQLAALQAAPKHEDAIRQHQDTVKELEGRVAEMDDLLRTKTQEIEENDDRFLQHEKEKRKMTTKIDNLTRKVQNLQTKLAAAKEPAPPPPPPIPVHMDASTSKQSPSVRPSHASHRPAPVPPMPPMPPMPPIADIPLTPRSRFRTASGPSAILRPKTPESRFMPPVFRAKTPEPKQNHTPVFLGSMQTTSFIGKKRSAPDDIDESTPVQGFTPDGLLDPERNAESTPRVRKSFRSGLGSGFTPVRNTTARPMTTLSPVRDAIPSVILDVTNNPRGPAQSSKRGWLGKIRGGASSQPAPTRSVAAPRSSAF